MAETGIGLSTFPADPPFTPSQLMDERYWTAGPAAMRKGRYKDASKGRAG